MHHIVTPSSPSNFRLRTLINFSEPKLTNVPHFRAAKPLIISYRKGKFFKDKLVRAKI